MVSRFYDTLEEALPNVYYFIEADTFSHHALWYQYHHRPEPDISPIPWEQISLGFYQTVPGGTCVSFSFARVYGKLVCFYVPTSSKVDYEHVESFLKPFWTKEGKRKIHCDAMNFHHCIGYCKQ